MKTTFNWIDHSRKTSNESILDILIIVNCILGDNCNECSDLNNDQVVEIVVANNYGIIFYILIFPLIILMNLQVQ